MSGARAIDGSAAPAGGEGWGDAVQRAARALGAASDTPRLDAELLLAHAAGTTRSAVLAFPERTLGAPAAERYAALVARRAAGEPVAYLLGEKEFFSLRLAVGPAVLIPRPETEHLVEAGLALLAAPDAGRAGPRVLDLGTGSGAIALAVKHARPDAVVVGADASAAALAVARANAERLGLDVGWVLSDWLASLAGERFDLILCNPPYVRSGDPSLASGRVLEPRAALDGGPDGLDAIRAVLGGAAAHLAPGGALVLEHGHDQRGDVARLAAAHGFAVAAAGRDLAARDRYAVLKIAA